MPAIVLRAASRPSRRADAGAAQLKFERISLPQIVEKVCQRARVLAFAKGLTFTAEWPDEEISCELPGDASTLERLFLTVLDNALNSPQTAFLSGTGIGSAAAPTATLSNSPGIDGPATLTFASQAMGTDSAARTLTLTNNGPTTLLMRGITIVPSGEFAEIEFYGAGLAGRARNERQP